MLLQLPELPAEGAVILSRCKAYHPDFSDGGNSAVLLEHPVVVGEQQFEAESEREDEGEPQQRAEDQRRHHGLPLSTERDVETGQRRRGGNYLWLHKYNIMSVSVQT